PSSLPSLFTSPSSSHTYPLSLHDALPIFATTALLATSRGWSAEQHAQAPSDDEVLVQANDRIAKHRQGDGIITVRRADGKPVPGDRKSTRLNSSHQIISYAVFCLKKKKIK